MVDIAKRDALVARMGGESDLVVTLEEFFDGNDDGGSIWCNLLATPKPAQVFEVLRAIRERADIADVRILVTQFDGDDSWPFSDTVLFVTRGAAEDVEQWLGEAWRPDEFWDASSFAPLTNVVAVPSGYNVVAAWWD